MAAPTETFARPDASALASAAAEGRVLAARLSLPFARTRWRGAAGQEAGLGTGSSVDFQDHRGYARGDDLRHVNWTAYARTDALVVKQHRMETAPRVDIALDVSASLLVFPQKLLRAAALASLASACARGSGAAARLWLVGAGPAPRPCESALLETGRFLDGCDAAPVDAPSLAAVPWRTGAFRVIVSDLLFPGDPALVLRPLAGGAGIAEVFSISSAQEERPDWAGAMELRDVESGVFLRRNADRRLLEAHAAAYARHFAAWRETCSRLRIGFARVSAEAPLLAALSAEAVPAGLLEPG